MLISLHTPKAGGSSFKNLLEENFKDQLLTDYKDVPLNKSVEERKLEVLKFRKKLRHFKKYIYKYKDYQCIHGHFLPFKYDYYLNKKNSLFITWLRDPLERLVSHYHYWYRSYDKKKSSFLHKKVVEKKWSFKKFAFSDEMKNFYSQFLWKFPIENFDFIGVFEYYTEDMEYFHQKYFNKNNINIPLINTNKKNKGSYLDGINYIKDLKKQHAEDYKLYNYAIKLRNQRINDIS